MIRIMFVCTGNICRSPLAHRMLEKMARERGLREEIHVESSGTDAWHVGEEVDSRMQRTAAKHGLRMHHRARRLSREDLRQYDIVFAMTAGHVRSIHSLARSDSGGDQVRVRFFRSYDPRVSAGTNPPDVPDPYYGGTEGFEEVFTIVERTCSAILDAIENGTLTADG